MAYFALVYHVTGDYLERRAQYRAEHLALATAAHDRGELLLAGAFAEPADAALLIWRCPDRGPIEAFVEADPYVAHGLVTRWEVRAWTVVIGADPALPR